MLGTRVSRWSCGGLIILVCYSGNAVAQRKAESVNPGPNVDREEIQRPKAKTHVTVEFQDTPISHALHIVAKEAGVAVSMDEGRVPKGRTVTASLQGIPAYEAFEMVLRGTGMIAEFSRDRKTIFIRKIPNIPERLEDADTLGEIYGYVRDSITGKGVVGGTIIVQGTKFRAITVEKGRFTIKKVPGGTYSLSVRMLGYATATQRVQIGSKNLVPLVILLHKTETTLSEVVTTATGSQRRVEVANDVARINVDSMMQVAPVSSVTDLLAVSRIPGVEVTPSSGLPGSPSRIRLRGMGSLSQSNDPVVIVDGMYVSAATSTDEVVFEGRNSISGANGGATNLGGLSNNNYVPSRLDDIDPNSIESIEILRGPSAVSLYGTQAANGVIVITTKRGKAGKTRWVMSINGEWNDVPGRYQSEYRGYGRGVWLEYGFPTECLAQGILAFDCLQDSISVLNPKNLALLTNEAPGAATAYSLSVSGGVQNIQYNMVGSFQARIGPTKLPIAEQVRFRKLNEPVQGWLKRPDTEEKHNIMTRLTFQPSRLLDLDLTVMASRTKLLGANAETQKLNIDGLDGDSWGLDTLSFIEYSADGTTTGTGLLIGTRTHNVTTMSLGGGIQWRPRSWINPHLKGGIELVVRSDRGTINRRRCGISGCTPPSWKMSVTRIGQNVETLGGGINFPLSLGRWDRFLSLRPSVGMDIRRDLADNTTVSNDSLPLGSTIPDINGHKGAGVNVTTRNDATGGWYADLLIGVLQRFYTTVGFRRDNGNALSRAIRSPIYPKLGTSWLISDEGFFPKQQLVNELRLRVAFGHSAVQPEESAIHGYYEISFDTLDGVIVPVYVLRGVGNHSLKPERAIEIEYGVDADLFNEHTQLSISVAKKYGRNVLVRRGLAPSVGGVNLTDGFTENIAKVFNRSIEMSVSHKVVDNSFMSFVLNGNFSSLLNRVDKIGSNVMDYGRSASRYEEGYPIDAKWQRPVLAYYDVDGNAILTDQEIVLGDMPAYMGSSHPDFKLTFSPSLSFFNGRVLLTSDLAYDAGVTQIQKVYDGWGSVDIHAPLEEQARARIVARDGFVQNVNVLRLNTASITVMLPATWLKSMRLTTASISLRSSNLGMWSQYRGRDPGVNSTPIGEGFSDDGVTIPKPRQYVMGIRINF